MSANPTLEKIVNYLQITYSGFAREIGVSPTILYHIKNGRNGISQGVADKIVKRFPDFNYDWIISGKGNMIRDINSINDFDNLPKYIYDISDYEEIDKNSQFKYLNQQAKNGWYLVSAIPIQNKGKEYTRFYFKKAIK